MCAEWNSVKKKVLPGTPFILGMVGVNLHQKAAHRFLWWSVTLMRTTYRSWDAPGFTVEVRKSSLRIRCCLWEQSWSLMLHLYVKLCWTGTCRKVKIQCFWCSQYCVNVLCPQNKISGHNGVKKVKKNKIHFHPFRLLPHRSRRW